MFFFNDTATTEIYTLSLHDALPIYVASGRVNDFYEAVFRDMAVERGFNPRAVSFDEGKWYEIDTLDDLRAAEQLFADNGVPPVAPSGGIPRSSVEATYG